MRSRCTVLKVQVQEDGVLVAYERLGQIHTLRAESVVLACPQYVVGKILENIEPERLRALRRLRYHSYLIGNILLTQTNLPPSEMFVVLGQGQLENKTVRDLSNQARSIALVATGSASSKEQAAVLTLYRLLPYSEGTSSIYSKASYFHYRSEMIQQIEKEILPSLGLSERTIAGIRLSRWGHTVPYPEPGLWQSGTLETLQRPHLDRVVFVHTDNWVSTDPEVLCAESKRIIATLKEWLKKTQSSP
jgi:hypothetical protein